MNTFAINSSIMSQLFASLHTLKNCIDSCPGSEWNERHNDYPFSQVVFHALFDCDYNLCDYKKEFREQKFHIENETVFDDYEELEDRKPTKVYENTFSNKYYEQGKKIKGEARIQTKTLDDILELEADVQKNMTKLKRYINSIRHIQHHAAQLGLRLQFITGKEMDWVSRNSR